MHGHTHWMLKASVLAIIVGTTAGCAATAETSQIQELQQALDRAQAAADQALSTANSAKATADDAARMAGEASAAAAAAQSCCNENRERIDRMFQKAMTK